MKCSGFNFWNLLHHIISKCAGGGGVHIIVDDAAIVMVYKEGDMHKSK